ncbi:MAG: DUF4112 domain-containing protein [Chitinophagaceae bacterium]|nr:MAG: DUF4112 domain-containing protein [Chitinophagaceae bacterium]
MKATTPLPPALQRLKAVANLMDSKFKIPGTNIRFGLDAIIGLLPGAGDLTGFGISGYMIWVMANNGASGFVLARMVLNVLVDTLFGSIPILGDFFDIAFKSNVKNMRLMEQHYEQGRHNGSAWKVILPVLLLLLGMVVGIVILVYWFISWLWEMGSGW